MQPILPNAVVGPGAEPGNDAVVSSSVPLPAPGRGHFVFGLFQEESKAEEALQKLRTGNFHSDQVLAIRGSAAQNSDGDGEYGAGPLPHSVIAAGAPFAPLLDMLKQPAMEGVTQNGGAPRITHQITDYLGHGGAVLIVAIRTAEQERIAARAFLTCKCDVLLTHEVATKI